MIAMGDNGNVDGNEGSSAVVSTEKGSRNKRKFLSELTPDVPSDASTLSLTEFPRYELLDEQFKNTFTELGSLMSRSEKIVEELEAEESEPSDWDEPSAHQLEKLLTNNLIASFSSAVKKIAECGYSEETAEWVVLNCGIYHGSKDIVSNVVDGALALLKREKEFNIPRKPVFKDLQTLALYTMLEMIHVVREVKPSFTIVEAMWCLLLCDLNLLNACSVEEDSEGRLSGGPCGPGVSEPIVTESKLEGPDSSPSNANKPNDPKQLAQSSQPETPVSRAASQSTNSKISRPIEVVKVKKGNSITLQDASRKLSGINRENIQTPAPATVLDEKSGGSRKGLTVNAKRDMLRQKAFHFEKSYKGRSSKGAFKAKVAAWGNMVLDKTTSKLQSDSSSLLTKTQNPSNVPSATLPVKDKRAVPVKDTESALPTTDAKSPAPSVESKLSANTKADISSPPSPIDYYAAIPYDESLKTYVPKDEKDETLLILLPHKKALEKELQDWTDWANEKVMQAARRLGKDQGELKTLRQEREDAEKFKKEKQTLEENTMKRLSEMEYALSNANGQIEMANSTVRRLEEENASLRKELEAAKRDAFKSLNNLEEAKLKEQEAVKKSQSWDVEKRLLLEELTNLKPRAAELQSRVQKSKERKEQFKILLRQEEKEKGKAVSLIDSMKMKREEEDAIAKAEEDDLKQVAELDVQKCKDDIKKLENMISELRFEAEASKIAALKRGIHGGQGTRLSTFDDNFEAGGVKPERECVMCMTEEISVVFLPCAHQVLCTECNTLHEKQGMNDCPSCRTVIQKRISVCYRGS